MAESLRILGIGDAKSRHFVPLGAAARRAGPRGAHRLGPLQPARGRARRPRRPPAPGGRPALPRPARAPLPDDPGAAEASREEVEAGPRPLALPPAVRLLDGARRARAARRQPVGEGRDRRRVELARGRGARAHRDRARPRARVRRQLAGARGRLRPARRRPREKFHRIFWHARIDNYSPELADRSRWRDLGWPDDAVVCLSLRNFRPYSNLDIVLKAFAAAHAEMPELRLFSTAGGGWTRDEFDALAKELGIEPYMAVRDVHVSELPVRTTPPPTSRSRSPTSTPLPPRSSRRWRAAFRSSPDARRRWTSGSRAATAASSSSGTTSRP